MQLFLSSYIFKFFPQYHLFDLQIKNVICFTGLLLMIAEVNAKEMINEGALWELVRISRDCSREDIKNLARRTLNCSPSFLAEMRRLRIDC